jgi:hypothetical protein
MNRKERRAKLQSKSRPTKWLVIGLGTVLGISHIGMIGMISRRSEFPVVNLPVGSYTSYQVEASKNGYRINYRANDPKVMRVERDVKTKGGFLGLGNNTVQTKEEYTMDGSRHLDYGGSGEGKLTASQVACIKAVGGGESTGALVGSGVGTAVAPSVTGIPIVGWLAAGWVTMFGQKQGSNIGGEMAKSLSEHCLDSEFTEEHEQS